MLDGCETAVAEEFSDDPTRCDPHTVAQQQARHEQHEPCNIVHPLLLCPPLPGGTRYLLVAHTWFGARIVLASGSTRSAAMTLNLARVRQRAARLGAHEVHTFPRQPQF